jgi:hypothetical protein
MYPHPWSIATMMRYQLDRGIWTDGKMVHTRYRYAKSTGR